MKIIVVGAGITGLALARRLLAAGHQVAIYESKKPGGLAGGFRFPENPGIFLEKYYHHFFKSDTEVVNLIKEMGLENDLSWLPVKSGLYAGGRTWPFDTPLDLLRFKHIRSPWQRLLMGVNLWRFKLTNNWTGLDKISCRDFFAARGNTEGFERLWLPLLRQKFGEYKDIIPASFLWGRVKPRAGSREKGRETLGYLRGGFPRLFERMAEDISQRGGVVRSGDEVRKVTVTPGGPVKVESVHGADEADRIVWTLPSYLLPGMAGGLPLDVVKKVSSIKYMAVTCLVLVLEKSLGEFYWLNNLDEDLTFGGLIEHTLFVPPGDYGGRHILYIVNYHHPQSRLARMDKEELFAWHRRSLETVYGRNLEQNRILHRFAFHDANSSPLYDIGYIDKMPGYGAMVENIHICNMEQVYPYDRNMNNCLVNAGKFLAQAIPAWTSCLSRERLKG